MTQILGQPCEFHLGDGRTAAGALGCAGKRPGRLRKTAAAVHLGANQPPRASPPLCAGIHRDVLNALKYLIISALSYNPHTNLHINKSAEA